MAQAVQTDRLTRRFRPRSGWRRCAGITALDDVSLAVGEGRLCAILGRNGAGKTTLLEILATVLLPDSGRASVRGVDVVTNPRAVRRTIAFAPSMGAGFFARLTGRQNLEYYAALHDVARRDWRARGQEAAELFGIADALDRRVDQYSDGMRQRLALARARMARAAVWLLDEPTRGLDPHARAHTQQVLRQLAHDDGATILISTHDLDEAARVCDQVLVLHQGRLTLDRETATLGGTADVLAEAYGAATGGDAL